MHEINRPEEIEQVIVAFVVEQPAFGQVWIADDQRKRGLILPPARRVLRLFAPRPGDGDEAAQGARDQERPGGAGVHRGAGGRAGEAQVEKEGTASSRANILIVLFALLTATSVVPGE